LAEAAVNLGTPVISYAYSNAATDRIAEVLQERCPHIGAIRYHSVESEARALRRYESESAEERPLADSTLPSSSTDTKQTAATQKPTGTEKTADELAMIEDEQAWFEYFTEIEKKDETWKGSKLARPDFKSMGLHRRALQNANIISHDIKCFAHDADHDIHAEFRTASKAKHFFSESPEEKKAYKESADKLLIDTLQKSGCVVTTLHKVGNKMLKDSKSFQLVLIDEGCQASEPETLLAWISNYQQALLIVIIGDPKQLPPTVKSKDFELMTNPFAAQLMRSYYEPMHVRGFPTFLSTEDLAELYISERRQPKIGFSNVCLMGHAVHRGAGWTKGLFCDSIYAITE